MPLSWNRSWLTTIVSAYAIEQPAEVEIDEMVKNSSMIIVHRSPDPHKRD
jgi:hypothetical protein